jgi:hypothetical protein
MTPKPDSVDRLPVGFEEEDLGGKFVRLEMGETEGQFVPGDGAIDFAQFRKGFINSTPHACAMGEELPDKVEGKIWFAFKFVSDDGNVGVLEIPWRSPKREIYARRKGSGSFFGCMVRLTKSGSNARPSYSLEFLDGKSLDDDVLEGAQGTKVFLERMSDGESPFVRDDDDEDDEDDDDEEIEI